MTPTRSRSRRALGGVAALSLSLGGAVGAFVVAAGPAAADTIDVTNTADDGSGTSLRGVLENATDGDVIVLTAGATYQLTICDPPAPAAAEGSPGWGDIEIDGAVTIQGNGATIEQTCPDRVLYTQSAITLENVTVTGGDVDGSGGGLLQDSTEPVTLTGATFTGNGATGSGGGIATAGDLSVNGSTISDNSTGDDGGGIKVFTDAGTTTIDGSAITGNHADGWGGGFEQQGAAAAPASVVDGRYTLNVSNSVVSGNSAASDGGAGLDTEDPADITVLASTLRGNHGGWGGAIGTFGDDTTLHVGASTLSGNTSDDSGGAVQMASGAIEAAAAGLDTAVFIDSTITGNTQAVDGAVNVDGSVSFGYVTMTDNTSTGESPIKQSSGRGAHAAVGGATNAANVTALTFASFGSVVSQPLGGPNCEIIDAPTSDAGYNFSDDTSCGFTAATSKVATPNDPVLGALVNNGGPTDTLLPLAGSPLLDAIPTSVCSDVGVDLDQRGVSRPQGSGCDIGAVEVEVVAPSPAVIVTPRFTG
jgi:predicted outer membrane repeat protein